MARIVSVVNQKGGVGKSTTAVNLAAYLADAGKYVLLVDLDPQGNATSSLGHKPAEVEGTYEAMGGEVSVKSLLLETDHKGLYVLAANQNLAGASVELVSEIGREKKLLNALNAVRNDFDYIIIDNPPSLGLLALNGLVAADSLLIPVQAEYFALEGLGQLMNTIRMVKKAVKPELEVLGAVLTMYDPRTRLSRQVLEELYRHFPERIFRSIIPRSVRLAEAPSHGKSILHYDPESKAAQAYERLAQEFILKHETYE